MLKRETGKMLGVKLHMLGFYHDAGANGKEVAGKCFTQG